nr:hypothetical protein [Roseimaritima multifibrata]
MLISRKGLICSGNQASVNRAEGNCRWNLMAVRANIFQLSQRCYDLALPEPSESEHHDPRHDSHVHDETNGNLLPLESQHVSSPFLQLAKRLTRRDVPSCGC